MWYGYFSRLHADVEKMRLSVSGRGLVHAARCDKKTEHPAFNERKARASVINRDIRSLALSRALALMTAKTFRFRY
ncbi:Protein of unknown function [Gryllus bimaculatus]|nr:Protein of unknown function [Gryllus bimaculatus]